MDSRSEPWNPRDWDIRYFIVGFISGVTPKVFDLLRSHCPTNDVKKRSTNLPNSERLMMELDGLQTPRLVHCHKVLELDISLKIPTANER